MLGAGTEKNRETYYTDKQSLHQMDDDTANGFWFELIRLLVAKIIRGIYAQMADVWRESAQIWLRQK